MNIDTLADLKAEIEGLLDKKIDDLSDSFVEAMSSNNDVVDAKLESHETRIVQLENLPA
jgi:hypothetical protein